MWVIQLWERYIFKLIAVVCLIVYGCSYNYDTPNTINSNEVDCFQDQISNIEESDFAEFINSVLLRSNDLPKFVNRLPIMSLDVLYNIEDRSCGISLSYVNIQDDTVTEIFIRVHIFNLSDSLGDRIPPFNCASYSDTEFPFRSSCVFLFTMGTTTYRTIILTDFNEELTNRLATQLLTNASDFEKVQQRGDK